MKSETKNCQNCKKDFIIEPEDFDFYEKIKIPPSTFCPECRLIRRMAYRNERTLYKRKCNAKGHSEEVISVFSPDKPDNIYCQKAWWGDSWDGADYARDYDFTEPFFVQIRKLWKEVPDMALLNINHVNSEYCSITEGNKNCYLVIGGDFNENALYSSFVFHSKDIVDCYWSKKCELCYELSESISCNNVFYSRICENCLDSFFLFNCKNCHDCFGCVNLRNASYQIFNVQYTKEEYKENIKNLKANSHISLEKIKKEFEEHIKKFPMRFANIINSVNCTGDNIEHARNVKYSFDVSGNTEDSKYLWFTYSGVKNCLDIDHSGLSTELSCDSSTLYPANRVLFSRFIFTGHDIQYSYNCHNSAYLFGCIGLKNKQYYILNKQYTKEEYEKLIPKIIKHMEDKPYVNSEGIVHGYGEFFPIEISPFAYNETVASEIKYLSKEEIKSKGYSFIEPSTRDYKVTKKYSNLFDTIEDVNGSICEEIISCEHGGKCEHGCTTAFRILENELIFYKRFNIPLPHLCPNCRHYERILYKKPKKLWHRQCMCDKENHNHEGRCEIEFETSYAPDRPEIVYCEKCYQQEVY